MLTIDLEHVYPFLPEQEVLKMESEIIKSQDLLKGKSGPGKDFLGWVDIPESTPQELIENIINVSMDLQGMTDTLVVIGIGGSYLGSRAVIEALHPPFRLPEDPRPEILFAGHHLAPDYLTHLLLYLKDKSYAIVVISKSGTTTEPAVAFRFLKDHLYNKYGAHEAAKRIIAITDEKKGALRSLCETEGYRSFVIPDDVGGRFSVLTPAGLLPLAVQGVNIRSLLKGASEMKRHSEQAAFNTNPVLLYAAVRNALYRKGKTMEVLVNYHPCLHYFSEWWKQLFGESEGKEGKGIFPASVDFTTDLHSLGQYLQQGRRVMFETTIAPKQDRENIQIPYDDQNLDDLNYLAGKEVGMINRMAQLGTILAHVEGDVPNISIEFETINEQSLGQLIYFFEVSCAVSGYTFGINPFDQPGVEAYKRNMFALLEKPGYEESTRRLKAQAK